MSGCDICGTEDSGRFDGDATCVDCADLQRNDPGTDIFDGRATGYGTPAERERWAGESRASNVRVQLITNGIDFDPDQQRTERQYDCWIINDACQVCYLADATCSAFGKRTCERCQDDCHRVACKYPLHPTEQREALYEELDHAIENLSESRAEHGMGAVSMGFRPSDALDGFDASPWEGFIAEAEDSIKAITAWIEAHSAVAKADRAFDAKVAEVADLYNVESPTGVVYDDIPF